VGASVATAGSGSGDTLGPSLNGTLKRVRAPAALIFEDYHLDLDPPPPGVSAPSGSEVMVKVNGDSKLWRSGPARLADFQPEDKLIAYARWSGADLIALGVEPMYEQIAATVTGRHGNRLRTRDGIVVLNRYTRMRRTPAAPRVKTLAAITTGHRIGAACRLDPRSGHYVAANIAVLPR